jgi:hypothetical protein
MCGRRRGASSSSLRLSDALGFALFVRKLSIGAFCSVGLLTFSVPSTLSRLRLRSVAEVCYVV